MSGAITTAVVGAVASSVVSGFLSPKPDSPKAAPPPPAPIPVKAIPLPDDQAVQQARRRSMASMQNGSGRASTILTDNQDSSNKLGA